MTESGYVPQHLPATNPFLIDPSPRQAEEIGDQERNAERQRRMARIRRVEVGHEIRERSCAGVQRGSNAGLLRRSEPFEAAK